MDSEEKLKQQVTEVAKRLLCRTYVVEAGINRGGYPF